MQNSQSFRAAAPRRHWILAIVLAFIVLPGGGLIVHAWQESPAVASTDPATETLKKEAEKAAAQRKWTVAADKFRAVVQQDEQDGRSWFMLGYCLHADGKLAAAIVAHQRAATFPRAKPTALYNLACAHALMGDRGSLVAGAPTSRTSRLPQPPTDCRRSRLRFLERRCRVSRVG